MTPPALPVFLHAPHRAMFLGGAVQSLAALLFWAIDLGARYAGLYDPPAWPFPAVWLHVVLVVYGIFPFFIFGFLMTALPRWVGGGALAARRYVPAFGLMAIGWLGVHGALRWPALLPAAIALVAAGWGWGLWALYEAARRGGSQDKRHAWTILVAVGVGLFGLLASAAGLLRLDAAWQRLGMELGLWGMLLPVFFTVSHRMLPFFSSTVIPRYTIYRPMPLLAAMLACFALHALGAALDLRAWLWPVDALAGGLAAYLCWKWQLHRSFAVPLLATHHVATAWLAVALLLYAVQGGLAFLGVSWGGLAPLHALGIGYFASMLLGMATRVTLGHSGHAPAADRWTWGLFWGLQAVVVLRLSGEFAGLAAGPLNPVWLAALGWLTVFGFWCARHLGLFVRPRADGIAG